MKMVSDPRIPISKIKVSVAHERRMKKKRGYMDIDSP
jgi:hypothetical protein